MSATASFTSEAVAEWVKIFPRHVTESYTSSVTFMKQLTVVAVSTITYLKNMFPKESYTRENLADIRLKILKKKPKHDLALFVSSAMTQAFEAFDKKYLHQLALCVYEGDFKAENLVEYYVFEYIYKSDGVTMNIHSKGRDNKQQSLQYSFDNIREQTLKMIRTCLVVMGTCQTKLPESYDISLRLYYNEDAPEGYQAPGFSNADESQDHLEATLFESCSLGYVVTPFHKLDINSYSKNAASSHEANPSDNAPMITQGEICDFDDSSRKSTSDQSESNDTLQARIMCACNNFDSDVTHALITCQYCKTQQHAACYGIKRADAIHVMMHCCTECSDEDRGRRPTDQRLAALPAHKRECLCIFRRTLEWISLRTHVSAQQLADKYQLSALNAAKLMKLLQSNEIIQYESDMDVTVALPISPDQLKMAIKNIYQSEESNIVDRLIAETYSQSSEHDPVGQVLSPMEKFNLQNATTLGKIVDPESPKVVEDETLKEYRDAIMSNVEKENGLPLSGSHNPVNVDDIGKKTRKRKSSGSGRVGVRTKKGKTNKFKDF